jgi:hypothetical protein
MKIHFLIGFLIGALLITSISGFWLGRLSIDDNSEVYRIIARECINTAEIQHAHLEKLLNYDEKNPKNNKTNSLRLSGSQSH